MGAMILWVVRVDKPTDFLSLFHSPADTQKWRQELCFWIKREMRCPFRELDENLVPVDFVSFLGFVFLSPRPELDQAMEDEIRQRHFPAILAAINSFHTHMDDSYSEEQRLGLEVSCFCSLLFLWPSWTKSKLRRKEDLQEQAVKTLRIILTTAFELEEEEKDLIKYSVRRMREINSRYFDRYRGRSFPYFPKSFRVILAVIIEIIPLASLMIQSLSQCNAKLFDEGDEGSWRSLVMNDSRVGLIIPREAAQQAVTEDDDVRDKTFIYFSHSFNQIWINRPH